MGEHINAPIEPRYTTGWDGTDIGYYVAGHGPLTWVVSPGIATPLIGWKFIIEDLQDRCTLVIIDPRGTYRSAAPTDPGAVGVHDHARDVRAVVQAERLERYLLGGWSMGVQVSLQYYDEYGEDVLGLLLINGAYEHVLSTVFPSRFSGPVLSAVVRRTLKTVGPALTPILRTLLFRVMSPDAWRALGVLNCQAEIGCPIRQANQQCAVSSR